MQTSSLSHRLAQNYVISEKLETLYTGGPICVSCRYLIAAKGNVASVMNLRNCSQRFNLGLSSDESDITCLACPPSAASDRVLIGYRNLLIKEWDLAEGKLLRTWKTLHTGPVLEMAFFEPLPFLLATGSADSTAKIWNLDEGYCTHNLKGARGLITCLLFATISSYEFPLLISGCADGNLRVYDVGVKGGRLVSTLSSHTASVTSVIVPKPSLILSGGKDRVVNIWSVEAGDSPWSLIKSVAILHPIVAMVPVVPDGKRKKQGKKRWKKEPEADGRTVTDEFSILIGCESGQVELWSGCEQGMRKQKELSCNLNEGITHILTWEASDDLGDSQMFGLVNDSHNILMLNSDLTTTKLLTGYNDEILSAAYVNNDPPQIALACNTPSVRLYTLASWDCKLLPGHKDTVLCIDACSSIPGVFASCSKDNNILIWLTGDHGGRILAIGSGHTASVTSIKFARQKTSFLASVSDDSTLKIWNIPKEVVVKKIDAEDVHLSTAATVVAHAKDITCVDVSPNDKLVATGSMDKLVKIWSLQFKGKGMGIAHVDLVQTICVHKRGIWDIHFSQRDQVIASASGDGTLKICSIVDGSCVRTFEGHDCAVLKVQFLSTGLQLLSADTHGIIKLWTIKTSECTKGWDDHTGKIWTLLLREDDEEFISGGSDSILRRWKNVTEEEAKELHEKKDENLEQEQALSNLLQSKILGRALKLAVNLNRPFTALQILKDILGQPQKFELAQELTKLSRDQHNCLLKFAKNWNTNTKHCHVAQAVLNCVLKLYPPEELLQFDDIKETLEVLISYSERHYERLTQLKQQSSFLDYIAHNMNQQ